MKKQKLLPKLGREAEDIVTGFKGILTSRTEFLTGCDQWGITPKAKDGSEYKQAEIFDVTRINVTGEGIILNVEPVTKEVPVNPGGPSVDKPRRIR